MASRADNLSHSADVTALAAEIRAGINDAEFNGVKLSEHQINDWIVQANDLLQQAQDLANGS